LPRASGICFHCESKNLKLTGDQVRILATKAEAKAIDQRCQELHPSVREIDFWKAEQDNLSSQLAKMQEKEKELQKTSFEALIVSLKDVQIMRETGVLG
jgi:hypothetical protein